MDHDTARLLPAMSHGALRHYCRHMLDRGQRERIISELCAEAPSFHGWDPTVFRNWSLSREALRLIFDNVDEGDRCLETGVGYSTVVFALHGAELTTVAPDPHEFERVSVWCAQRGVDTSGIRFISDVSQDVLPSLGDEPLDFVLIDGDHAFPVPFIDFFYAARRLRPGGLLMVDDTQIRTGMLLREFLSSEVEVGRWRLHSDLDTTSTYEKLTDLLLDDHGWESQPFNAELRPFGVDDLPLIPRLRSKVRFRRRLAAAFPELKDRLHR